MLILIFFFFLFVISFSSSFFLFVLFDNKTLLPILFFSFLFGDFFAFSLLFLPFKFFIFFFFFNEFVFVFLFKLFNISCSVKFPYPKVNLYNNSFSSELLSKSSSINGSFLS
jgi:hypothetical protein